MSKSEFFPISINTQFYTIPTFDFDVLEVFDGTEKSSSEAGTIREVEVTPAGVDIRFLSGGGKEVAPSIRVTTKFEFPTAHIVDKAEMDRQLAEQAKLQAEELKLMEDMLAEAEKAKASIEPEFIAPNPDAK